MGAWSSKWVENHTLVSWDNFGGIKTDRLKITVCGTQEDELLKSPFDVVMEGIRLADRQPPVLSPSGAISAFQPRSHCSEGGPHQWLIKAICIQCGTPLMGNLRLAELCQFSLQSDGSTCPIWFLLFAFHNKPFPFLTPS